jgi:hypothetical protein
MWEGNGKGNGGADSCQYRRAMRFARFCSLMISFDTMVFYRIESKANKPVDNFIRDDFLWIEPGTS